jgi:hypothetical protein
VLRGLLIEESFAHDRRPSDDARSELEGLVAAHGPDLDAAARARLAAMAAREVVEMPVAAASRLALAEEALATAVASGRSSLVLDARELLVSALLAAGEPERVEDAWYALRHDADRVGRPRARWSASLLPAAVALAEGRVEEADELAARAKAVGEELGIPDAMGAHGVHQVVAHLLEGRLGELTDLVDLVVAVYPAIAAWPAAAALARAQAGDADGALPHLERYVERREAQRTRYFDRPGLCLAAQAAWLVGDDPTTRRVADVVVHALPADPTATVVVGVGAAVLGPVDLHLALAHARLGDVELARSLATSAEALALRLGWRPWVAAARAALAPPTGAEPDQTSPPRPGPAPASSPLGMHRLP